LELIHHQTIFYFEICWCSCFGQIIDNNTLFLRYNVKPFFSLDIIIDYFLDIMDQSKEDQEDFFWVKDPKNICLIAKGLPQNGK
jgi:hypothetical protein